MKHKLTYGLILSSLLIGQTGLALAGDQESVQIQDRNQVQTQEQVRERDPSQEKPVYGWQLMTEQERLEYRHRMRSMKTLEEREQFRFEHHQMMQERAQERGLALAAPRGPGSRGMGPGGFGGNAGGGAGGSGSGGGAGGR